MSIRKRVWKNGEGLQKTAWVVDYVDQGGKRRLKTFERKKDADDFHATAKVEIKAGIHTADSSSITRGGRRTMARGLRKCRAGTDHDRCLSLACPPSYQPVSRGTEVVGADRAND